MATPFDALSSRVTSALHNFSGSLCESTSTTSLFSAVGFPARGGPSGRPTTNPLSRGDFLTRVSTYRIQTWFGKPLSPFTCARYGWVNSGVNRLSCPWCRGSLECGQDLVAAVLEGGVSGVGKGGRPPSLTLLALRDTHLDECPWRACISPAHFTRLPTPRAVRGALGVEGRLLTPAKLTPLTATLHDMTMAWDRVCGGLKGRVGGEGEDAAATTLSLHAALEKASGRGKGSRGGGSTTSLDTPTLLILCGWRTTTAAAATSNNLTLQCCLCGASGHLPLAGGEGSGKRKGDGGEEEEKESTEPPSAPPPTKRRRGEDGGGEGATKPLSSLLLAAHSALAAAAAAIATFTEEGANGSGSGSGSGGSSEKLEEEEEGACPTYLPSVSGGGFHPVNSHTWCCPYLRPYSVPTTLYGSAAGSQGPRGGSGSGTGGEGLVAASAAISSAVIGMAEGELLGKALVEGEEGGGGGGGCARLTLLAQLKREEEGEGGGEEEGEGTREHIPGWCAAVLYSCV